jgi:hypothetical protein
MMHGADVSESQFDIATDGQTDGLQLSLTRERAELAGRFKMTGGANPDDYQVVVFPVDR